MHKKKIIKKIADALEKLDDIELKAIYQAICKFKRTPLL